MSSISGSGSAYSCRSVMHNRFHRVPYTCMLLMLEQELHRKSCLQWLGANPICHLNIRELACVNRLYQVWLCCPGIMGE